MVSTALLCKILVVFISLLLQQDGIGALKLAMTTGKQPAALVTFDVGSTLLKSTGKNPNGIHKEALTHACHMVFSIDPSAHIDDIDRRGNTDSLSMLSLADQYNIPPKTSMSKLKKLYDAAEGYVESHFDQLGDTLTPLPGVTSLLRKLNRRDDVVVGLATGNLEGIAWAKLRATDLLQYFPEPRVGGFSTDFCSGRLDDAAKSKDRAELCNAARRKAIAAHPELSIVAHIHIGDSHSDVLAGELAGCEKVFGVATGKSSEDELRVQRTRDTTSVLPELAGHEGRVLHAVDDLLRAHTKRQWHASSSS
mmetsp:Transcript_145/g.236  ORF Transcript_145/g.236 Transcript_145/m.236 type:complete len:308 (-) Transcript_145:43-966(-)